MNNDNIKLAKTDWSHVWGCRWQEMHRLLQRGCFLDLLRWGVHGIEQQRHKHKTNSIWKMGVYIHSSSVAYWFWFDSYLECCDESSWDRSSLSRPRQSTSRCSTSELIVFCPSCLVSCDCTQYQNSRSADRRLVQEALITSIKLETKSSLYQEPNLPSLETRIHHIIHTCTLFASRRA